MEAKQEIEKTMIVWLEIKNEHDEHINKGFLNQFQFQEP